MTTHLSPERSELTRPDLTSVNGQGPAGQAQLRKDARQLARDIDRPVTAIRALAAGTAVDATAASGPGSVQLTERAGGGGLAEDCHGRPAVRLILGNDHRLFADALADVLPRHGVIVTARARSPQEVLVALATEQADMCMVSGRWLNDHRLNHLRQVREHHPTVDLIILSEASASANCDISTALAIGAAAIVSQHEHVADLLSVLHRVHAGERAIDAAIAPKVGSLSPPAGACVDGPLDLLTIREQEVLMLMTDGRATKEIASALAITLHTARTHVQSVLVKLGVHSRLEASGLVARSGLVGPFGRFAFGPEIHEAAEQMTAGWSRPYDV